MYASARAPSAPHLSLCLSLSLTDDKFAKEELGLDANVYQTHATAIAANNSSHKKYFDYDCFYGFVMRWQRCSFAAVGRQVSNRELCLVHKYVLFTKTTCVSFTRISTSADIAGVRRSFLPTCWTPQTTTTRT